MTTEDKYKEFLRFLARDKKITWWLMIAPAIAIFAGIIVAIFLEL